MRQSKHFLLVKLLRFDKHDSTATTTATPEHDGKEVKMSDLGKTLKERREQAHLSQMRLSVLSGVSRDRITRIECGYTMATKEEEQKLRSAIRKHKEKSKCLKS